MGKIAWVTDSTAGLDKDFIEKHNVFVTPMLILFGEDSYLDGVTITPEEFYKKMQESKTLPTTSQPIIGETVKMYEEIKSLGYDHVVAIHISSSLSGTYQTSKTAAEMAEVELTLIDSKLTTHPLKELLKYAISLNEQGKTVEEIKTLVEDRANHAGAYVMVGSLEQLHKGGRMNGAQLLLGNLLQIRPILLLEDGKLEVAEKVRSEKKAKKRLIELLGEKIAKSTDVKVAVIHAAAKEEAETLKEELKIIYPNVEIEIAELSPAVGVHTGTGTIAVSWT